MTLSLFSRGYSEIQERMSKNSVMSRSCFNCAYYYQSVGDKEEVCQNDDVLEYDIITEGHRVYCTLWKPCSTKDKIVGGKKTGRNRLL